MSLFSTAHAQTSVPKSTTSCRLFPTWRQIQILKQISDSKPEKLIGNHRKLFFRGRIVIFLVENHLGTGKPIFQGSIIVKEINFWVEKSLFSKNLVENCRKIVFRGLLGFNGGKNSFSF